AAYMDDVIFRLNELMRPTSCAARSRTNSCQVPVADEPAVNAAVMSRSVTEKLSADPPARFDSVATWPLGATTWMTRSPRNVCVMLVLTFTVRTSRPAVAIGRALRIPVALASGMFLGTSVEVNARSVPPPPPPAQSAGIAVDRTIAVVELWFGDDAPEPI